MGRWDNHGDEVDLSDPVVLGWLAGLLEGEGSFKWKRRTQSQRHRQPQISVNMCDEDVIRKVGALWGAGVHPRTAQAEHHSDSWETAIGGRKAVIVMLAVKPLMGARRSAKIEEILEEASCYYDVLENPHGTNPRRATGIARRSGAPRADRHGSDDPAGDDPS